MHECKTDLVANCMVAPDFPNENVAVLAQAARDIHHARRDIQMERGADLGKVRPLRQRLQMIDRLPRLDLNNSLKAMTAFLREQDEVRIQGGRPGADRGVLFDARIHAGFELTAKLALQEADNPVMLQLFPDRPHENRTHQAPPKC